MINWTIIKKSLSEDISNDEQNQLDDWLALSEENVMFYNDAKSYYHRGEHVISISDKELSALWQAFIKNRKKRVGLYRNLIIASASIAAAVVFLSFYLLNNKNEDIKAEVMVGHTDDVQLIIEGSSRIYNIDSSTELVSNKDGIATKSGDESRNILTADSSEPSVKWASAKTKDKRYNMTLSDGTKVWLNRNSEIRFPLQFKGNERVVEVTGEVFFDVVENKQSPFIVLSNYNEVTVLGTQFTVINRNNTPHAVALVDGSVNFLHKTSGKTVTLKPGQKAVDNGDNTNFKVEPFDKDELLAWIDGRMIIKSSTIKSIISRINEEFEAEIKVDNSIIDDELYNIYTGANAGLEEILGAIERAGGWRIEIKEGIYTITK